MSKGKLVVIDGGDASGKTTQAKLLVDYLIQQTQPVSYFSFPRYKTFYGKVVAQFLSGEFGSINDVSPYLASLAYSLDRASAKEEMEQILKNDGIIVANRYATSNLAHQSAKFKNEAEREKYITWDIELEYAVHGIPKEDIVIYLYVPWQIATKLAEKRNIPKDIHEMDTQHVIDAEKMYLQLTGRFKHWVKINCVENDKLLKPSDIHSKVIDVLEKRNIIDKR